MSRREGRDRKRLGKSCSGIPSYEGPVSLNTFRKRAAALIRMHRFTPTAEPNSYTGSSAYQRSLCSVYGAPPVPQVPSAGSPARFACTSQAVLDSSQVSASPCTGDRLRALYARVQEPHFRARAVQAAAQCELGARQACSVNRLSRHLYPTPVLRRHSGCGVGQPMYRCLPHVQAPCAPCTGSLAHVQADLIGQAINSSLPRQKPEQAASPSKWTAQASREWRPRRKPGAPRPKSTSSKLGKLLLLLFFHHQQDPFPSPLPPHPNGRPQAARSQVVQLRRLAQGVHRTSPQGVCQWSDPGKPRTE